MSHPRVTPEQLSALFKPWAEKFLSLPQIPMAEDVTSIYLACAMGDCDPNFPPAQVKETFQYRVGEKRAEAISLTVSPAVLTFLSALVSGPGGLVMYLYALRYHQKTKGLALIGMDELSTVFPIGFPSDDHLSAICDEQKGFTHGFDVDNLLDHILGDVPA